MAQTYNGGGGGGSFDYFSSGTATKQAPFVQVPKSKSKAKPKAPTAPRSYSPPPSNYGSGGGYSNTYRSGKSVGSNSAGRIAKTSPAPAPAPPPKPMSIQQWLAGDTVYKQQKSALAQALKDYSTRNTNAINEYGISSKANRESLVKQQGQSREDLLNDYLSRGVQGGAQQQALTDFDTDWNKRLTDFDTTAAQWNTDAATQLADYTTSNTNSLTKAEQDAIARRAAKYGI